MQVKYYKHECLCITDSNEYCIKTLLFVIGFMNNELYFK